MTECCIKGEDCKPHCRFRCSGKKCKFKCQCKCTKKSKYHSKIPCRELKCWSKYWNGILLE